MEAIGPVAAWALGPALGGPVAGAAAPTEAVSACWIPVLSRKRSLRVPCDGPVVET